MIKSFQEKTGKSQIAGALTDTGERYECNTEDREILYADHHEKYRYFYFYRPFVCDISDGWLVSE